MLETLVGRPFNLRPLSLWLRHKWRRSWSCPGIIPDVARVGAPAAHRIRVPSSGATHDADPELRRSAVVGSVGRDCRERVPGSRALGGAHTFHCLTCVWWTDQTRRGLRVRRGRVAGSTSNPTWRK